MAYTDKSCEEFVKILSGSDPTPGGGGASALVGAVGAALGNMVGSLTVGKKKYQDVEQEIREKMEQTEKLQQELLVLVQKDADVFEPLAKAYSMPKDTKAQQEAKQQVMEKALKEACAVPLEIMEKCCQGIRLCRDFAEKGSTLAVSDAGAGAVFCKAALQSASLNVYINTKAMKDREFAKKANEQSDRMLEEYTRKADEILEKVFAAIK